MTLPAEPPAAAAPAPQAETACRDCPLRPLKLFHEPTGDELDLVLRFTKPLT